MKRVLLTGMSGTGKSAVIGRLAELGYKAVDLDSNEYSEWITIDPEVTALTPEPERDWVWKEDRVRELLSTEDAHVLFVSGCAENMGQFLRQFDHIILLSVSPQLITERLAARTNNSYGKQPDEVAQVLALKKTVEPLLRKVSNHEIDTSVGIDEVVANVLRITG
jgi:dephospho-CoA kinase